jgi:hypothetical protein
VTFLENRPHSTVCSVLSALLLGSLLGEDRREIDRLVSRGRLIETDSVSNWEVCLYVAPCMAIPTAIMLRSQEAFCPYECC